MELKNCPQCGKVFTRISRDLCPDCIAQEDEMIKQIQQYLDEHANSTISDISEGTGIPSDRIILLLQEGRLVTKENSGLLKCERCGKPISLGRFCSECSTTLTKLFSSIRKESGQKVYVREYYKKMKR